MVHIGGTINGLTITSGTIAQSAITSVSGAIVDTGTASQTITALKTFSGGLNLSGGTVNCNGATITTGSIAQTVIYNISDSIVDTGTTAQIITVPKTFSGLLTASSGVAITGDSDGMGSLLTLGSSSLINAHITLQGLINQIQGGAGSVTMLNICQAYSNGGYSGSAIAGDTVIRNINKNIILQSGTGYGAIQITMWIL